MVREHVFESVGVIFTFTFLIIGSATWNLAILLWNNLVKGQGNLCSRKTTFLSVITLSITYKMYGYTVHNTIHLYWFVPIPKLLIMKVLL